MLVTFPAVETVLSITLEPKSIPPSTTAPTVAHDVIKNAKPNKI